MQSILKAIILLSLLGFFLFIFSCASMGNKEITDPAKTSQIKEGETTKAEVLSVLGDPSKVKFTDNNEEVWEYVHTRSTTRPASFIPLVGIFAGGMDAKGQTLTIRFDHTGTVKKVGSGKFTGGGGSVLD